MNHGRNLDKRSKYIYALNEYALNKNMNFQEKLILAHLQGNLSAHKFSLPLDLYSFFLKFGKSVKYSDVFDIGSFKGAFVDSLNSRSEEFPGTRIHCFDAFRKNLQHIENTSKYPDLKLNHTAVIDGEQAEVTFSIPRNSYTGEGNTWGGRAVANHERAASLSSFDDQITVPAMNLTNYIRSAKSGVPGLLKIDVQGGELDVVKGATNYLQEIPLVYMECQLNSHRDIHFIDFMQNAGFEVFFDEYQIGTHIKDKQITLQILNLLNITITNYVNDGCIYCRSAGSLNKLMKFLKTDGSRIFTYFQTDLMCINKKLIPNWRRYFLR